MVPPLVRAGQVLAVAACALLFLQAAGTVELGYTVRPSQALFLLAVGCGLPLVWRGWMELPASVRAAAAALLVVYLLSAVLNDEDVVATGARGAETRSLVTLIDLLLGLAVLCLVAQVATRPEWSWRVLVALVVGATIAGMYGVYQLPARPLGLPLADINNALNSDGLTRGYKFQGTGLFGFERLRGSFTEPRAFAAYLTTLLPLFFAVSVSRRGGSRWLLLLAAAPVVVAAVFTTSSLAWGALVVVSLLGLLLFLIGRGRPIGAGGLAILLGAGFASLALLMVDPTPLSDLTNRPATSLQSSAEFRKRTWASVGDEWSQRPVLGYGPGQSAVQLAEGAGETGEVGTRRSPLVLGSAQGLWSASLVDAGILGLAAWLVFLGLVLFQGARRLVRRPTVIHACLFVSAAVAVLGSQISADRLDLRAWIVLGLLLAPWSSVYTRERLRTPSRPGAANQAPL